MNRDKPCSDEADNFWSVPDRFNILDALSLSFSFVYFLIIIAALFKTETESLLVLQSNMNLLMSTILGGYFGDQIVNRFSKTKAENIRNINNDIESQNLELYGDTSDMESYDDFIYEEDEL